MARSPPPVLIAPDAFGGELRAPVVAAAVARGLERAGVVPPPELCPVAGGGRGTTEVLLPVLGGETADGFALIEDGGSAIVERASTTAATGARIAAAVDAGAEVVLVAAGGLEVEFDAGAGAVEAIEHGGGLRGAALVVLCELRAAWNRAAAGMPRDPRGIPMTAAGGGLAGALWSQYDARLLPGAPFVLEELGFDARMRAARAVIVGEGRLDRATLEGRVAGEIATRARQAGVPCHAIVGEDAIDRFDARILDLQAILSASAVAEIEAAGEALAAYI
ncbi:MAG TPA: glycerate kinase [Solirubrobacteraceae bacterium]|nr:glycerate kinase [Solirubrobacteraceae bacterium]